MFSHESLILWYEVQSQIKIPDRYVCEWNQSLNSIRIKSDHEDLDKN